MPSGDLRKPDIVAASAKMFTAIGLLQKEPPLKASVTQIVCGRDTIVATGLCGRLRGWTRRAGETPNAKPNTSGEHADSVGEKMAAVEISYGSNVDDEVGSQLPPPPKWTLSLDESSTFEVANNRKSSYPYRYLLSLIHI